MNAQIPPEIMALLEELSQGGIAEDQNDLLAAQYKTADQMRNTKMPGMRSYGDNHVVGPNPMEVAAAAIQQYRGGQMQRDSMDQMKGNVGTTGKGVRALMLAKLLREYQQPPEQAPTGTVGGLPTPPGAQGIPFAQTPPWEEPYYPGLPDAPAAPKPPRLTDTSPQRGRGYGG